MKYINDFIRIKKISEKNWNNITLNKNTYGFQIQRGTKWNDGLSENQIIEFQNIMGFEFPEILKDYYTVMNGIDKEQINVFGNSGVPYSFSKILYSFPNDINIINDLIQWIYKTNKINEQDLAEKNISRIFPIFSHRFMLVDHKEHFILSMHGDDITLFAYNIIDLFNRDLEIKKIKEIYDISNVNINFWLDDK